MAARKNAATPAVTPFDVTHTLATAKPSSCGTAFVTLAAKYGDEVATAFAAAGCKRLPRHSVTTIKGHVSAKPVGLMTSKQRAAAKAAAQVTKAASKVAKPKASAKPSVTVNGVDYVVVVRNGKPSLRRTVVTPAEPKAPVVIAEVPAERQVAAPKRVTKATRPVADSTANRAIARVTRQRRNEVASADGKVIAVVG